MDSGEQRGRTLRVTVAQLDFTVGDVPGNTRRIVETLDLGRSQGADVVVFPELALSGYPPEDLLLRASFLLANGRAIAKIAEHTAGLTAIVGFPHRDGDDLYNAAAVLHHGQLAAVHHKARLPNYSVFDEERYFRRGSTLDVVTRAAGCLGVSVCEDIWVPAGPPQQQALAGAEVLVNISASPFSRGKSERRERMLATRAADNLAFLVFCNLVGGQDELVFDGRSAVFGPTGRVLHRAPSFAENVFTLDLDLEAVFRERLLDPRNRSAECQEPAEPASTCVALAEPGGPERPALTPQGSSAPLGDLEEVHAAIVMGLRDYARKNGFRDAVLGVSGGIDSALAAAVAVDALGPEHVLAVAMPSRYTSESSLTDARDLARLLGVRMLEIPIDGPFQTVVELLGPHFEGRPADVTEENVQPRLRGIVLMALSNKLGYLVLTTGNKSETSVGYVTLYGDSAGGFAPLKDVTKTLVYELAKWRNTQPDGPRIPEHSISRAPSAELRPDQLDVDSLPPYDTLDPILAAYVEEERAVEDIVAMGFDREVVERVARMVDAAEYKRRQSPPGIKITDRAFGRDRRMPITSGWSRSHRQA